MRHWILPILAVMLTGCAQRGSPATSAGAPTPAATSVSDAISEVKITVSQKSRWSFQYANGKTSSELHLPANVSGGVPFRLNSTDVIHAMMIPDFRMKQDAVPEHESTGHFPANAAIGTHDLICAELCGPRHSECRTKVVVESPEDFRRWLESK